MRTVAPRALPGGQCALGRPSSCAGRAELAVCLSIALSPGLGRAEAEPCEAEAPEELVAEKGQVGNLGGGQHATNASRAQCNKGIGN